MLTKFTLPKQYDGNPVTKRLWLQSRRNGTGEIIPAGQARGFTLANIRIGLDALWILIPRLFDLLRSPEYGDGLRLFFEYFSLTVASALLPSLS